MNPELSKPTVSSQTIPDSNSSKNSRSRNSLLIYFLLFALIAGIFLPCLRNDFFYWYGDDTGYVTENSHVKSGLTLKSIVWAFTNIDLGNWHPLTWVSHMMDCEIYDLKPWGHHLTSVLLHAFNTVLLFALLLRMTKSKWRSFIVALLFGLHPLRVESVAWVAERKDVLAAFFWMLTLLLYALYSEKQKTQSAKAKIFYGLTLAGFACGLMSKGIVVTLPFALLLLDYWPLRRLENGARKLLLEKIPFFVMAIATSAVTYAAQKSWGFVQTIEKYSLAARFENAMVSYLRYIGKIFWPFNLSGFYPHPNHWPTTIVIAAIIFVAGISFLAVAKRRSWPWLFVGWFWYFGTLVPVIGFVQLGDVAMADRYSYIPMVGILFALVWGLNEATKHWRNQTVFWTTTISVALIFCIAITVKHIGVYKDSVILWQHNFKVTGDIKVAQYALALSLDKQGRTDEAIKELEAVLRNQPDRHDFQISMADVLKRSGRPMEAIQHYRHAISIMPGLIDPRFALANILYEQKFFDEAIVELKEAIELTQSGRAEQRKGGNLQPADIYFRLATMLKERDRVNEAIPYFQSTLQRRPDFHEAHFQLGISLVLAGRLPEAATQFQILLQAKPDPRAYVELGRIRAVSGNFAEAISLFQQAIKLVPNYSVARMNLAMAHKETGDTNSALKEFQEVLRLDPNSTFARQQLDALQKAKTTPAP